MNETLLIDEIENEEIVELLDETFTSLLGRMKETTDELSKLSHPTRSRTREYKKNTTV